MAGPRRLRSPLLIRVVPALMAPRAEALAGERRADGSGLFPLVLHRATNAPVRARREQRGTHTTAALRPAELPRARSGTAALRSQQLHACTLIMSCGNITARFHVALIPRRRICRKRSCRSPQSRGRRPFVPTLGALFPLGRDAVLQDVVLRVRPDPAL